MSIAVVAGLGNPGPKYRKTRHNVGFDVVDQLAARANALWSYNARFEADIAAVPLKAKKLMLVKPRTFMNSSGRSLGAVMRYRQLEVSSLLVIYDDITLDIGRTKLSHSGSAGGHNGISDILEQLGSGFLRYRIGIGAKPNKAMDLADYVLSRFTEDETKLLASRLPDFLNQIDLIQDVGAKTAMNTINQRPVS